MNEKRRRFFGFSVHSMLFVMVLNTIFTLHEDFSAPGSVLDATGKFVVHSDHVGELLSGKPTEAVVEEKCVRSWLLALHLSALGVPVTGYPSRCEHLDALVAARLPQGKEDVSRLKPPDELCARRLDVNGHLDGAAVLQKAVHGFGVGRQSASAARYGDRKLSSRTNHVRAACPSYGIHNRASPVGRQLARVYVFQQNLLPAIVREHVQLVYSSLCHEWPNESPKHGEEAGRVYKDTKLEHFRVVVLVKRRQRAGEVQDLPGGDLLEAKAFVVDEEKGRVHRPAQLSCLAVHVALHELHRVDHVSHDVLFGHALQHAFEIAVSDWYDVHGATFSVVVEYSTREVLLQYRMTLVTIHQGVYVVLRPPS